MPQRSRGSAFLDADAGDFRPCTESSVLSHPNENAGNWMGFDRCSELLADDSDDRRHRYELQDRYL